MPALSFLLLFICIARHATTVTAAALAVETLFNIDFSTDERGGCRTVGRDTIQSMLDESLDLAKIGGQLVDDYDAASEAKRLLGIFVKGNTGTHRTSLKNNYAAVLKFVESNENVPAGGKPYLFCSDNWLEKNTLRSEAKDSEGNGFPKADLSGFPALISDVPEYMEQRKNSAGKTPYWSVIHKSYLFDSAYGRRPGYCSDTNVAVTSDLLLPATITLCPSLFKLEGKLGAATMSPLKSTDIPARPRDIPSNAQRLSDILPASTTLFHELFHLILGTGVTYPSPREQYVIIEMGKMTAENALKNPETYAVMAIAYWYTVNVAPVDGNKVEFYGFFSTRG